MFFVSVVLKLSPRTARGRFSQRYGQEEIQAGGCRGWAGVLEAYVSFLEYMERSHEDAKGPARGHSQESDKAGLHKRRKVLKPEV